MTQTALCRQCSNCQNVFTQGLPSMLQGCSWIAPVLYCTDDCKKLQCRHCLYSGYISSHNSPDIWCKISISSPGQQNYPKGSFRKLSQKALFELFYEHIPISLIPSLAMYISNQKISLQRTNCVVQLDRKLTWRRWCLWTGVDLTVDLTNILPCWCACYLSLEELLLFNQNHLVQTHSYCHKRWIPWKILTNPKLKFSLKELVAGQQITRKSFQKIKTC